jgi:hypothetical protein
VKAFIFSALALVLSVPAFAATVGNPNDSTSASASARDPQVNVREAQPANGGDLRAPSPKALDPDRKGFFQLGAGPAYGAGLESDSSMYNIVGSYNFNLSNQWTAKAIVDTYFATGSVSSRLLAYGLGAEYYFSEKADGAIVPYIGADVALGNARNAVEKTTTGAAVGGGAGFKFQAAALNFDINAHYEQMLSKIDSTAPSIFGLRAAVAF